MASRDGDRRRARRGLRGCSDLPEVVDPAGQEPGSLEGRGAGGLHAAAGADPHAPPGAHVEAVLDGLAVPPGEAAGHVLEAGRVPHQREHRQARARQVATAPRSERRPIHSAPGWSVTPCAITDVSTASAAMFAIRSPWAALEPSTSRANVIVATPFGPNHAMNAFSAVFTRRVPAR